MRRYSIVEVVNCLGRSVKHLRRTVMAPDRRQPRRAMPPYSRRQDILGARLQDHVEGSREGAPDMGKATRADDLGKLRFTGLRAQSFTDLLIK